MYIELISLNKIRSSEGCYFEFSHNIVRFIEYEKIVVFLVQDKGCNLKIIALEFSQEGGRNYLKISWEFQIIDGMGEKHEIVLMERKSLNNKELIYCYGWGFDIGYYLDPETGKIVHQEPIK
jgi:hypothetical protein